ncbi:hypothetical protein [Streptacidiphilus rugosus]|uniref:hypothetical protein n=1 Tax=Streptacidiphilus rugosus TaxID=405783 RepID=UPI0005662121|nr:hypothetical protein [Streptacidiphilus rugosus]
MYAQPVLDDNTTPTSSWSGHIRRLTAPTGGRTAAAGARIPRQRCYRGEDGRLRDATVHDPRLRYPHSYTRADIALALAVAED